MPGGTREEEPPHAASAAKIKKENTTRMRAPQNLSALRSLALFPIMPEHPRQYNHSRATGDGPPAAPPAAPPSFCPRRLDARPRWADGAAMPTEHEIEIGIAAAHAQAVKSLREGGVPIGAALLVEGVVVSLGHNRRVQNGSNVLHGETDCLENAGHHVDFARSFMVTTLAPCLMCTGAVQLFKIPTLVVMDDENTSDYTSGIDQLRTAGVEVIIAPHAPTIEMMRAFQTNNETRRIWLGDVGT